MAQTLTKRLEKEDFQDYFRLGIRGERFPDSEFAESFLEASQRYEETGIALIEKVADIRERKHQEYRKGFRKYLGKIGLPDGWLEEQIIQQVFGDLQKAQKESISEFSGILDDTDIPQEKRQEIETNIQKLADSYQEYMDAAKKYGKSHADFILTDSAFHIGLQSALAGKSFENAQIEALTEGDLFKPSLEMGYKAGIKIKWNTLEKEVQK